MESWEGGGFGLGEGEGWERMQTPVIEQQESNLKKRETGFRVPDLRLRLYSSKMKMKLKLLKTNNAQENPSSVGQHSKNW